MISSAKIALPAAERLRTEDENIDAIEVWCSIQSILIAAGNISKILWPISKSSKKRGKILQRLLDVDGLNLLTDRDFRNHFEHYDERIENWFNENQSAVYMDSRIDSFESIWGKNLTNSHRAYNPSTQILTFRGESMDIGALLNVLEKVRDKCRDFVLV